MKNFSFPVFVKLLVSICLIMALTMWAYFPTTENMFVWDDKAYLFGYEFWIAKLHPYHIMWMFSSLEVYNWHPLTWLSWAFDYQLYGGLSTWGYHLSNNILHSINSALLFVLSLVVFGLADSTPTNYPFRKDNNALIAALMAALLFAVHPQHVESVAWVAERKDLLCQLFLLLSTLTYVKYVICEGTAKTRWFFTTLGLFTMALLSKPMAVTFPVVLLLIDVYPLRRFSFIKQTNKTIKQQPVQVLLREKLAFFLASFALILITLLAQQEAMSGVPFDLRVLNAFNSTIFYLQKLFIPLHFTPQYPYFVDIGQSITWKAFMPIVGFSGLTLAAFFAWKKGHHAWMVAWLIYLVTLSPVLGLIQVGGQGAADRYAYLPTLPVYLLMGAGILSVLNKTTLTKKLAIVLVSLASVFLLTNQTLHQIKVWKNDLTLWSNAISLNPNNELALLNIGGYHYDENDYEKASFYFEKVGKLRPNEARTYVWRALTYTHLEQYQDAIDFHVKLGRALEAYPELRADQFCIQYNIGWLFAQIDMFGEASELFSRVDPSSSMGNDAHTWLNWLNNKTANQDEAPPIENLPRFCTKLLPSM